MVGHSHSFTYTSCPSTRSCSTRSPSCSSRRSTNSSPSQKCLVTKTVRGASQSPSRGTRKSGPRSNSTTPTCTRNASSTRRDTAATACSTASTCTCPTTRSSPPGKSRRSSKEVAATPAPASSSHFPQPPKSFSARIPSRPPSSSSLRAPTATDTCSPTASSKDSPRKSMA